MANRQFLPDYGAETGTFCAAANSGEPAHWQADVPNGTYHVQAGRVNAEEEAVTAGDTRIVLESGQAVMQAPAEPKRQVLRTWTRRVTVRDGRLDVELGRHDKASKQASVISWLIVRDAAGAAATASEPATGIAAPANHPVPSRSGAWARPAE